MLSLSLILLHLLLVAADNAYVIDTSGSLVEIDLVSGVVNPGVAVLGNYPNDILYSDGYVYVVNSGSDNSALQRINVETWVIDNLAIGTGYNCWGEQFLSSDTLLISATLNNSLVIVSTEPLSVLSEIPGVGSCPEWMCLAEGFAWVACGGWGTDNNLVRVDLTTMTVSDTIEVETNCQSVGYDGVDELFVVNSGTYGNNEGSVSVINAVSGNVTENLLTGGFPSTVCIRDNKAYIGDGWGPGVYVVTTDTHEVIHNSSNPIFTGGTGFAIDSADNLFVSDTMNGQVRVYDQNDQLLESYAVSNPGALTVRGSLTGIESADVNIPAAYLRISPVPASAIITVTGAVPCESIHVFDLSGRRVASSISDESGIASFSINNLPEGLYSVVSGELSGRVTVLR
jgi:sugar lactone lactonase YvrE